MQRWVDDQHGRRRQHWKHKPYEMLEMGRQLHNQREKRPQCDRRKQFEDQRFFHRQLDRGKVPLLRMRSLLENRTQFEKQRNRRKRYID